MVNSCIRLESLKVSVRTKPRSNLNQVRLQGNACGSGLAMGQARPVHNITGRSNNQVGVQEGLVHTGARMGVGGRLDEARLQYQPT